MVARAIRAGAGPGRPQPSDRPSTSGGGGDRPRAAAVEVAVRRASGRWLAALALLAAAPAPAAPEPALPTLVLAFDCVPYEEAARLAAPAGGGRPAFAGMPPPVPLVSSFPSTTSVAFGGILEPLGLARSPGYEARFFDWQRRRVRGGMPWSYYRIGFHWRDFFDWNRANPLRRMASALRPQRASLAWFARAIDAFLASREPLFFAYNGATDTLAHLEGPDALGRLLAELEPVIERARRRRPFHLVMLSDHGLAGGAPLVNAWRPVRRALGEAGFRYRRRLRRPRDVALTPFGLVSSFELYSRAEEAAAVARAVAAVPGVDLCVRRDGEGFTVTGAAGEAAFRRRQTPAGVEWHYRTGGGDPLGYAGIGDGRWHSDRYWFEQTAGHRYPDALHRLARSFDLVENPASVLCSLDDGYMFGASKTAFLSRLTGSRLRWTHGALARDATLGFLWSDDPRLAPSGAQRFDRALAPLAGR